MQNIYELMVLFPPKLSDTATKKAVEAVKKELTEVGGTISVEEDWSIRQMTYDIKGESEARYFMFHVELDAQAIKQITIDFNMEDNILRFMFTQLPEDYKYVASQHEVEIVDDIIDYGPRAKNASAPMKNPKQDDRPKKERAEKDKKLNSILEDDNKK